MTYVLVIIALLDTGQVGTPQMLQTYPNVETCMAAMQPTINDWYVEGEFHEGQKFWADCTPVNVGDPS